MASAEPTGSKFIDQGKTPEEWAVLLKARGFDITPRTIKEKANRLKERGKLGDATLILPEQLDNMFMEDQQCRSKSTQEETNGGSKAGSNTTACQSLDTTDKALVHLHKLAQQNGSKSRRIGKGVVTSLAKKQSGSRS